MSRPGKKEKARKVLWIVHHVQPHQDVKVSNIVEMGRLRRWRMTDLQEGLEYALEKRWVEQQPDRGSFKLTPRGGQELITN